MKLATTAIFFPDTTIMIGVCIPSIVKAAGFRRISEINKGSFLIGSTGWTYHHSHADYDRKNIVVIFKLCRVGALVKEIGFRLKLT